MTVRPAATERDLQSEVFRDFWKVPGWAGARLRLEDRLVRAMDARIVTMVSRVAFDMQSETFPHVSP